MQVKGRTFEIQEYTFDNILEGAIDKYKSKIELIDKYKGVGDKDSNERLKLYDEVRKLSSQYISLLTIRDHTKILLIW